MLSGRRLAYTYVFNVQYKYSLLAGVVAVSIGRATAVFRIDSLWVCSNKSTRGNSYSVYDGIFRN